MLSIGLYKYTNMNLFKHIANLLALWTIPYVIVLFFMVITGFAFTYNEAILSEAFIVISFFYNLLTLIMYMAMGDDEGFDSIKLFKTN
jgi:glucan phosphoethanolaminetransferase (alkaline phosphatase superfamily)